MTFKSITVNFSSPEEQKEFEDNTPLGIFGSETFTKDSGFESWTEFDVTDFTIDDIKKYFIGE